MIMRFTGQVPERSRGYCLAKWGYNNLPEYQRDCYHEVSQQS